MGDYLRDGLESLRAAYPGRIRDIRGLGLLLGLELDRDGRAIVDACLQEGLIINCTAGNVLRFVPPLIIEREHINTLITTLHRVLAQIA